MENVLIIGGGVAGLSAGIFAQMRGYNAIICEKHTKLGGNLTGWRRGEYHIDNCIHWLTGTNKNTELFRTWIELGALGSVEVYQGESLYTYERSGQKISLYRDLNKLTTEMLTIAPEDKKQIIDFLAAVKTVQGLAGIAGRSHDLSFSFGQKLRYIPTLAKYWSATVGEISKKFKNEVIRGFLNCFLTKDFSALALVYVFATFTGDNGGVPAGGSEKMAERMTGRFINLGGKVFTGKEVVKINTENRRAHSVTFADGSEMIADAFIITADPKTVFGKMLDAKMPLSLEKQYNDKKLKRFSCFQCAFSCDTDKLPFTNDFIFDLPEKYGRLLSSDYLIVREFTHEKGFAPEGKTVLQTMLFCDEATSKAFIELKKNRIAYTAKKQFLANVILQAVTEKLPELKDKLEIIDTWTPATYKDYVASDMGSFMSFCFGKRYFPVKTSSKVEQFDNVFIATQWQVAPGGLPIAAECGRNAVDALDARTALSRSFKRVAGQRRLKYSK